MQTPSPTSWVRRRPLLVTTVALIGCLAVAGVVVWQVQHSGASLGQRFTMGQPVVARLGSPEQTMVWARRTGASVPGFGCSMTPADGRRHEDLSTSTADARFYETTELTVDGATWEGVVLLSAYPAMDYTVTCGPAGVPNALDLAIGKPPRMYAEQGDPLKRLNGTVVVVILSVALIAVGIVRRRLRRGKPHPASDQRS